MGEEDTPERLTLAQREQYENKYVPGKIARGETPKTPEQWRATSTFWQTQVLYGRAVERGVEVVFGLRERGWESQFSHDTAHGRITADHYLPKHVSQDDRAKNLECKAGVVGRDRELTQLYGYVERLQDGEKVIYFTRAEKLARSAPEVRQLITALEKRYLDQFTVMRANEKVFQRVLEAGTRALAKEQREAVNKHLAQIPARERDSQERSLEAIARDYVREVDRAAAQGCPRSPDLRLCPGLRGRGLRRRQALGFQAQSRPLNNPSTAV